MRHYTQRVKELFESFSKAMRSYMDNVHESMFYSAQSIVNTLTEWQVDTEHGLEDSENENEDNA